MFCEGRLGSRLVEPRGPSSLALLRYLPVHGAVSCRVLPPEQTGPQVPSWHEAGECQRFVTTANQTDADEGFGGRRICEDLYKKLESWESKQ